MLLCRFWHIFFQTHLCHYALCFMPICQKFGDAKYHYALCFYAGIFFKINYAFMLYAKMRILSFCIFKHSYIFKRCTCSILNSWFFKKIILIFKMAFWHIFFRTHLCFMLLCHFWHIFFLNPFMLYALCRHFFQNQLCLYALCLYAGIKHNGIYATPTYGL